MAMLRKGISGEPAMEIKSLRALLSNYNVADEESGSLVRI